MPEVNSPISFIIICIDKGFSAKSKTIVRPMCPQASFIFSVIMRFPKAFITMSRHAGSFTILFELPKWIFVVSHFRISKKLFTLLQGVGGCWTLDDGCVSPELLSNSEHKSCKSICMDTISVNLHVNENDNSFEKLVKCSETPSTYEI